MNGDRREPAGLRLTATLVEMVADRLEDIALAAGEHYNLRRICEEHLIGRYTVGVIGFLVQPQLAAGDQMLAAPTLVRRVPAPLKRIISTLASTERVLVGLDIQPSTAA